MNIFRRILWGLVFIFLGLFIAGNTLNIININFFFTGWWTLFIIVPSIIDLLTGHHFFSSLIWLLVGVTLLLICNNIIGYREAFDLLLPVILVLIGLYLMFGGLFDHSVKKHIKTKQIDNEYCSTFEDRKISFKDKKFDSVKLDAVFGKLTLDLRDAKLSDEPVIKASSIFGGIEILVPNDICVKVSSTPIFGGVSNNKKKNAEKVIYLDATTIFGGVEIR